MFHYIQICFQKYATFSGRAQRAEFWYFYFFATVTFSVLGIISTGIAALFGLITSLPLLAVGTRRLHDTGHSGWWIFGNAVSQFLLTLLLSIEGIETGSYNHSLLSLPLMILVFFIPIFGILWPYILFMKNSTPGPNKYGENPKDVLTQPTA